MLTDWASLRYAVFSRLGCFCLAATFVGMLYTTASDALVSPKLKYGDWEDKVLYSYAMTSYANVDFISQSCATPISNNSDIYSSSSCLDVSFSGTCK
jgi:hypothetical protein